MIHAAALIVAAFIIIGFTWGVLVLLILTWSKLTGGLDAPPPAPPKPMSDSERKRARRAERHRLMHRRVIGKPLTPDELARSYVLPGDDD